MARRTDPAVQRGWLNLRSPLHEELDWLWEQNERRFQGGHRVYPELWRFDWETLPLGGFGSDSPILRDGATIPRPKRTTKTKDTWDVLSPLAPGEHYRRRQESAIYVNFMEAFATDIVGHLFKQAPAPDAGLDLGEQGNTEGLGGVRRKEDIDTPTRGEMIYYNTDGVGVDGLQWDAYWSSQLKLAMATGFRWQYVDAPSEAPRTRGRERKGFRPFLVGFSPRQVINHHPIGPGPLEWAIIDIWTRRPQVTQEGSLTGNDAVKEKLLLVRSGNTDLGTEFGTGGWWRFSKDLSTVIANGTWDKTEGEIPMVPLIYDKHPEMVGRPGLTELGNASVMAMNMDSAAGFDAFDSAGSVIALRGVDARGFNLFIRKVRAGNRYAPLPAHEDTGRNPEPKDVTGGEKSAAVFEKRIDAILKMVDRIKGIEVNSAPQASGLAQQAGFTLGNVPRLSLVAANLETAQNAAIHWIENRFGITNPSGSVRWPKKFELVTLTSSAQAILQLEAIAGIHSEELESRVIVGAAKDEGFIPDNAAATKIENELRASRKEADKQASAAATAKTNGKPDVPGERRRNMPPEPAQTKQPVKTQIDGPNVE